MKLVFLDIDGVLNSVAWWKHLHMEGRQDHNALDPGAIHNLNAITRATGASIVVSSTWRLLHSFAWLTGHLKAMGVEAEVLDYTPESTPRQYRGWEIARWLAERGDDVEGFVILDDDSDMVHLTSWHVQTDPMRGLLAEHVDLAVRRMGQGMPLDLSGGGWPDCGGYWYDLRTPDERAWLDDDGRCFWRGRRGNQDGATT